jgi:hypothetical protein
MSVGITNAFEAATTPALTNHVALASSVKIASVCRVNVGVGDV